MSRSSSTRALRQGVTTIELLVVMVVALMLLAGGVSLFTYFQRSLEQQHVTRTIQTQIHRSAEQLIRLVRSADEIVSTSTASRLGVFGGLASATCGDSTCWIEVDDGRLIVHTATSGVGREVELARAVDSLRVSYGTFDAQGRIQSFSPTVPGGGAADILGVRIQLYFSDEEARGEEEGVITVHAARRAAILQRIAP